MKDYSFMIGKRYGKLVVTDVVRKKASGYLCPFCVCNCDCGKTGVIVRKTNIERGSSKSCGCSKTKTEQEIIRDHSYLVGQKFGKLTVVKITSGKDIRNHMTPVCVCKCDCGSEDVYVLKNSLTTGNVKSCGCLRPFHAPWKKSNHGFSSERLYGIWCGMVGRCLNSNNPNFHYYGGRGISICTEWLGDDGYLNFRKWSYENGYSENLTIDRIDSDKGYSPYNCRWADTKTQAYNRRVSRRSESGVRGVFKRKDCRRWSATITKDRKKFYVGYYDSLEEAASARNRYIHENGLQNLPSYIPGTREEY